MTETNFNWLNVYNTNSSLSSIQSFLIINFDSGYSPQKITKINQNDTFIIRIQYIYLDRLNRIKLPLELCKIERLLQLPKNLKEQQATLNVMPFS